MFKICKIRIEFFFIFIINMKTFRISTDYMYSDAQILEIDLLIL